MTKDADFNLWHYTTAEGLKGILYDQTLWATDYRYLNDESEITYSKTIIRQAMLPKVIYKIKQICCVNSDAKKIATLHGGVQNIADIETRDTIDILFDAMLNPPDSPQRIPFVLSFCKVPKNDSFKCFPSAEVAQVNALGWGRPSSVFLHAGKHLKSQISAP